MTASVAATFPHTERMTMILKLPFFSFPALRRGGLTLVSVAILFIAGQANNAWAAGHNDAKNGLNSLETFVKTTQSGRASFTQVVTSPAKEGQTAKSKTSTGTFEFLRPNRFKFVYKKPFEQSIVADGQTLWLYDADLNQVTSRKLTQVLSGTPAAVIAAAADLKGLEADFALSAQPDRAGLQWVLATPKTKDGQLQNIQVGFKSTDKGSELMALEILDSFGQKSVMSFNQFEVNPALTAASFQFKSPAGADVIRQ
jgi:outer membrane lipoprotein carrier protein